MTTYEVNRVLDVGRLLLSVLTPDELEELAVLLEPTEEEDGSRQAEVQ